MINFDGNIYVTIDLIYSAVKNMKNFIIALILLLLISSCSNHKNNGNNSFIKTVQVHLDSISNKDIEQMKSTLPTTGEFYLTLPNGVITKTVKEFVEGQTDWFKSKGWSFETEIIKQDHGAEFGFALVIADYHEKNRGGKPYHHKMFISYALKKINNKWLVVKDHASTIKKTQ